MANTRYIQVAPGDWFVPAPLDVLESHAQDYFGFDTTDAASMRFCANLRNTVVASNAAGAPEAMRVEVRVWWHAQGGDRTVARNCALPSAVQFGRDDIRKLHASTLVSWNEPSP